MTFGPDPRAAVSITVAPCKAALERESKLEPETESGESSPSSPSTTPFMVQVRVPEGSGTRKGTDVCCIIDISGSWAPPPPPTIPHGGNKNTTG